MSTSCVARGNDARIWASYWCNVQLPILTFTEFIATVLIYHSAYMRATVEHRSMHVICSRLSESGRRCRVGLRTFHPRTPSATATAALCRPSLRTAWTHRRKAAKASQSSFSAVKPRPNVEMLHNRTNSHIVHRATNLPAIKDNNLRTAASLEVPSEVYLFDLITFHVAMQV